MVQAANNAIPHAQAGTMRILAISLPRRSAGLPNVPTFREQGFDVVMDGWYVFVGPRGMSAPQIAFWDNAFARVAESPEWKKFGEQSGGNLVSSPAGRRPRSWGPSTTRRNRCYPTSGSWAGPRPSRAHTVCGKPRLVADPRPRWSGRAARSTRR